MPKAIHGISVAHFFETHGAKLQLETVTGDAGMHRLIHEGSINRPALALTGFFKYFAHRRVQVLGADVDCCPLRRRRSAVCGVVSQHTGKTCAPRRLPKAAKSERPPRGLFGARAD